MHLEFPIPALWLGNSGFFPQPEPVSVGFAQSPSLGAVSRNGVECRNTLRSKLHKPFQHLLPSLVFATPLCCALFPQRR